MNLPCGGPRCGDPVRARSVCATGPGDAPGGDPRGSTRPIEPGPTRSTRDAPRRRGRTTSSCSRRIPRFAYAFSAFIPDPGHFTSITYRRRPPSRASDARASNARRSTSPSVSKEWTKVSGSRRIAATRDSPWRSGSPPVQQIFRIPPPSEDEPASSRIWRTTSSTWTFVNSPPSTAYMESHHRQRRLQEYRRTNTVGSPTSELSPWTETYISLRRNSSPFRRATAPWACMCGYDAHVGT